MNKDIRPFTIKIRNKEYICFQKRKNEADWMYVRINKADAKALVNRYYEGYFECIKSGKPDNSGNLLTGLYKNILLGIFIDKLKIAYNKTVNKKEKIKHSWRDINGK